MNRRAVLRLQNLHRMHNGERRRSLTHKHAVMQQYMACVFPRKIGALKAHCYSLNRNVRCVGILFYDRTLYHHHLRSGTCSHVNPLSFVFYPLRRAPVAFLHDRTLCARRTPVPGQFLVRVAKSEHLHSHFPELPLDCTLIASHGRSKS